MMRDMKGGEYRRVEGKRGDGALLLYAHGV
jgi:hypothetical protein